MACQYSNTAPDKERFTTYVCTQIKQLTGRSTVNSQTSFDSDTDDSGLGWDGEAVATIGNGIEARLDDNGCRVCPPIADSDYMKCGTVGDMIGLIWSRIQFT